jgi:hypothetical protein
LPPCARVVVPIAFTRRCGSSVAVAAPLEPARSSACADQQCWRLRVRACIIASQSLSITIQKLNFFGEAALTLKAAACRCHVQNNDIRRGDQPPRQPTVRHTDANATMECDKPTCVCSVCATGLQTWLVQQHLYLACLACLHCTPAT